MLGCCKKYALALFTLGLLFFTIWIFYLNLKDSKHLLTFAMLDIGQGDALFIESPTGTQILVDAGPPRKIMGELARVMSPFDRTIDAIIITNPDADHIAGFEEVLKNYKVGQVFEPGTLNGSKTYQNLKEEISRQNIRDTLARRGMRLNIGEGAYIDILFPDRDVVDWTSNDGSIVARLSYGATSVMLTGDATKETEKIILSENQSDDLRSSILKVGHHGSHTSTSEDFVRVVAPRYALISLGKNNKYGHPHQETLETLSRLGVQTFRTDLLGSIIMTSDGLNSTFSFHR